MINSYDKFFCHSHITDRPTVVCLCGSTRFYSEFQRLNFEETMKGNIILTVGFYVNAKEADWALKGTHGENIGINKEQKTMLDNLHKRKIDISDEILVINVDGYIGESTANEIEYASSIGKRVRYLEPDKVWKRQRS